MLNRTDQKKESTDWIATDPSLKQYGRRISEKVFEFKEEGKDTLEIDLTEYNEQEIEYAINTFGYTAINKPNHDCIFDLYGQEAYWVMAECIFEE